MNRPLPAWAIRRRRARQAEADERWHARHGSLVNVVLVDVVWSNDTQQAYHRRCRAAIPRGPLGTIDIAVDPAREEYQVCAACSGSLTETA